uniref:Uncharacterized protein n=1 Tax=Kalanchoe fedtschenkoi TaxID=63787 RepID=A0A7N0ZT90_KALFE
MASVSDISFTGSPYIEIDGQGVERWKLLSLRSLTRSRFLRFVNFEFVKKASQLLAWMQTLRPSNQLYLRKLAIASRQCHSPDSDFPLISQALIYLPHPSISRIASFTTRLPSLSPPLDRPLLFNPTTLILNSSVAPSTQRDDPFSSTPQLISFHNLIKSKKRQKISSPERLSRNNESYFAYSPLLYLDDQRRI